MRVYYTDECNLSVCAYLLVYVNVNVKTQKYKCENLNIKIKVFYLKTHLSDCIIIIINFLIYFMYNLW